MEDLPPNSTTELLGRAVFVRFDPCDMVMDARRSGWKQEITIRARRIATSGKSAKTNIETLERQSQFGTNLYIVGSYA